MELHFRRFSIVFTLLLTAAVLVGQVGKIIDQNILQKEYDDITNHLIVTHPALYRFVTIDSLDFLIRKGREQITGPMDQLSFYKIVSPLYAAIGDGHTKILIDQDLYNKILSKKGIFPYRIWIDQQDQMFIIDSELENTTIPIGSEITHINGMPAAEFISEATNYVGFEHVLYRNSIISDNFNWLLALILEYEDQLELEIKQEAGQIKTVDLLPFKKWKRKTRKEDKKNKKRLLTSENNEYRNLGDQIGYLKIYEFGSYHIGKYISNIKNIFRLINAQKVHSLIIDLRDNAGGDPKYVEALIHTISDIPFCRTEMMYQLKKGKPNSYYRLLGNTSDEIVKFAANHMVFSGNEEAYREPITFDNEFNGQIYVLVNEKSYSAAATMASVIKCYDLGTVVGVMTGGTRIFQAFSVAKSYSRSKLRSIVSSTMIFTSCSGFEDEIGFREGIVPDIEVTQTLDDILQKKDVQLEYVLRMIDGKITAQK